MIIKQKKCVNCECTKFEKPPFPHGIHVILTVFTCTTWAIVWACMWDLWNRKPYTCAQCGQKESGN